MVQATIFQHFFTFGRCFYNLILDSADQDQVHQAY
jgi:hypothetical protein